MKKYMKVPVSGAILDEKDKLAIIEIVMDGWITEGKASEALSEKLKKYVGSHHCTLVNSGSSANLLALSAIKDFYTIDKDHNFVVTCATGFPTTVGSIVQAGLVPYFVDVNPKTLNPDIDVMLDALSREDVVGIIQAHTLGFPFDAREVRNFCDAHGKFFVEDCCDALGAEIYGQKVGKFGHASTFSFFPAHHITTGEGGAVLMDNGNVMRQVEIYRDWGRACWCLPGESNTCNKRFDWKWDNLPEGYDHKYTFIKFGYNMKMTDLQAALGSSQINKIKAFVEIRWDNFCYLYTNLYKHRDYIRFVDISSEDFWVSPFGLPITVITDKFTRKELVDYLEENGIVTRPVFAGNVTRQPMFDGVYYENHSNLSGSDFVMENTFWIGCHPELSQTQLDYVVETFDEFFKMKGLK